MPSSQSHQSFARGPGGPWRGEGRFRRGVAAFYRLDRALSYALIARMKREELLKLAHFVHGALGS